MTLKALTHPRGFIPSIALPAQPPAFLGVLGNGSFRYLLMGNGLAYMGEKVLSMAIAWLVLEMTSSNLWVGIINGIPAIAAIAFSIVGGVMADRGDRRVLLMRIRLMIAGLILLAAFLVTLEVISLWHLMVIIMLATGVIAVEISTSRTMVYDVVGNGNLLSATSMNSLARNLGYIVGPSIIGVLIARMGVGASLFMISGFYIVATIALMRIKSTSQVISDKKVNVLGDMREGLAYIARTPKVAWLVALAFMLPLAGVFFGMMPVYAKEVLQVGPQGLGMMMAAFGTGGVISSLVMSSRGDFAHKGLVMTLSGVSFGIGMVVMALSSNFHLTLVAVFFTGMAGVSWMTLTNTMIQRVVSDEMRGRVAGIFMIGVQLMSLGWLIGGVLATLVSNEGALIISAAIFGGFGLFAYVRSKDLRTIS